MMCRGAGVAGSANTKTTMGMNLGGFLLGLASLLEAGKGFILKEWD